MGPSVQRILETGLATAIPARLGIRGYPPQGKAAVRSAFSPHHSLVLFGSPIRLNLGLPRTSKGPTSGPVPESSISPVSFPLVADGGGGLNQDDVGELISSPGRGFRKWNPCAWVKPMAAQVAASAAVSTPSAMVL